MVSLETINVGQAPNDKKGDPLRNAMQKVVLNFTALNEAIQGVLDGKGKPNGYASLGVDGRLLAAQAPIVYAPALPTSAHDLNDYITPGVWYQTTIAGATAGTNYPTVNVGFLEVAGTGTPVLQVYTTRTATLAAMQRFWRIRMSATSWSVWKEVADTSSVVSYVGGMAAAQDLNNYTTRGLWAIGSSATAAGGTNFPIGHSGFLLVLSSVHQAAATTGVFQTYYAANSNRVFTRALISNVWTAWTENLGANLLGAASGIAQLGTDSRLLPAQAPILYSTAIPGSTDANAMIVPGVYYVNSDAAATPELNWPERLAGQLTVKMAITGNSQVTQVYTTRNGTGGVSRTYKRVRFGTGAGTWGTWQQLARYDDAMTAVPLSAATDANTLIAPNVYYTWTNAAVITGGSNWPSIQPSIARAFLQVVYMTSTQVHQRLTIPFIGNTRPLVYERTMIGASTWGAWRVAQPVSTVGHLPLADCGDVYVDGLGWHSWNGTAYALTSLAATLPTTAHDLNTYQTPGQYRQATTAGATAGSNYPAAIGGLLEVTGTGTAGQTKQTYTLASSANVSLTSGPRQFWRMALNTTWSPWQEVLTAALGMTHQFLTAATDANTLIADNTWYSWVTGTVFTNGSNWPAISTIAGGWLDVRWLAAATVMQTVTVPIANGKPRVFQRYGNTSTGVWQTWKCISPMSQVVHLPTADCGDIYVDGLGWYAWDGSAYVLTFAGRDHGQCRFQYVSATQCRLVPYNGNGLLINGRQQRIPAAGVNIANTAVTTGSVMYIYAYMNGTTMTLEASTAVPVIDSNTGVMVKTGDVARTLVGMAARSQDGNFYDSSTQRYVASWFNQRRTRGYQYANPVTSSDTYVTLSAGITCLVWAGNIIDWNFSGQTSSGVRSGSYIGVQVNGAGSGGGFGYSLLAGSQMAFSFGGSFTASAHGLYSISAVGQGSGPAGSVSWAYEQTTSCDI